MDTTRLDYLSKCSFLGKGTSIIKEVVMWKRGSISYSSNPCRAE